MKYLLSSESIQAALKVCRFLAPCSPAEISEAEDLICCEFPEELKSLYLLSNGIIGKSNSLPLYPLLPRHHENVSLLGMTLGIRENLNEGNDLAKLIFFGADFGDIPWGINCLSPYEIIQYAYDWERPKCFATNIIEAFERF